MMLALGIVIISNAQDQSPQKRVRVEIEVTEDGKTSTSTQEIELNRSNIDGELEEMVEEIEMILEEAVRDIEETDLEIVIRRHQNGTPHPRYRHRMRAMPDTPGAWHMEGKPSAFLGVVATKIEGDDLEEYDIEQGSLIENVVGGSSAEKAGLKEGDIITSIGGESTPDFSSLAKAIRSHEPGEEVEISYVRDGKQENLSTQLGEQHHRIKHFNQYIDEDGDFDFEFDFEFERDEMLERRHEDLEKKAFLGIEGKSVEEGGGVRITKIFEESAAEESDLEEGDRIFELNDQEVEDVGELVEIIRDLEPGDDLKVEFEREGKKMKETISLGSKADVDLFQKMSHPHHPHMKKSYRFKFVDVKEMENDEIEDFASKTDGEFTTDNTLEVDGLIITPNPNDGQFRVKFELPEPGDMQLKVFDANGRKIVEENVEDFEGLFSNEYDIEDTDSGVYILTITQNGQGKVSKIVKQ
ncbi:MAG: PDZ domain-containing protein [Flavobacteriales bacterium]|jgi:C-terminal processing protease CtpA/Prc|nr:PDZ domain-containing protein [Flavobacteriales bacterium]MBT4705518.1 PDZ domain-containing protein [Flavobacteriales bacterium]MBT5132155.1 PDZ domain-containing protein [Flavobacteriales bacterium]MBT6132799.1 PDZ domain-containing protein [Flavobacteriales bacterium]MBT6384125.1 PDZ domain-containing protein [Flavobacteriales bacterium]